MTGHLTPWAAPVTGTLGWQLTTASHQLATAVTASLPGSTVPIHEKGHWHTCLPHPALTVTVLGAGPAMLWCRLGGPSHPAVLALALAPWPAAAVLGCPLADLPASGRLSVRDVRVTTRMGRTVRYLIPQFTPA